MTNRSVGEILKAKREAKNVSLRQLAKLTKIDSETLALLEANQWDKLPDVAFIKGYINAYASLLDFDPTPVFAILRRDYPVDGKKQFGWLKLVSSKKKRKLKRFSWWIVGAVAIFLAVFIYVLFQWLATNQPPSLVVYTPEENAEITEKVVVRGMTDPAATIKVNEQPVALDPDGSFETEITFPTTGVAAIVVQATDQKGKTTTKVRQVNILKETEKN